MDSQNLVCAWLGAPAPTPREGSHELLEFVFGGTDHPKHLVWRHGASGGDIRVLCGGGLVGLV